MALDPSIIGGIKPIQIDSPVNTLAQMLKVQGMQQESQLGQAKLDEYTRSKARQNKLLELVQSLPADTTDDQRISALKGDGYFDEADKLETGMLARQKTGAEVKAKEWEAQSKKLDLAGQAFGFVRQNPTLDAANQVLDYLGQNGIYTPETVAQYKQAVAADPTKIASLADTAFRTVLSAKDQLMKTETRNLGGTTQTMGVDPVTGKTTVLNTAANTQSPDNKATNDRAAADAAAGRAQQERASLRSDARAREANQLPRGQVVQTDDGPMLVDPRAGTAQPITANGKPLQPKLKSLPAPIQKALLENDASLRKVDKALAAIEKYPEALGASNYLGDTVQQRTDPKGVEARTLVADIGSLKIHDRSGAAVTAAETPRLKPFIPAATDNPATVKKKLGLFRQEYEAIQSDINSTYTREQGYRSPATNPTKPGSNIDALLDKYKD